MEKLLEWSDGKLKPVAGWPAGGKTDRLTVWQGRLLAMNHTGSGVALHAFDGNVTSSLTTPRAGRLRDLAADGATLWAVVSDGPKGSLWRTIDGVTWEPIQRFDETPIAVAAAGGDVFVGTYATGGGSLWGPRDGADLRHTAPAKPFAPRTTEPTPAGSLGALDTSIEAYIEQRTGSEAGIDAIDEALRNLPSFDDPIVGERLSMHLAALDIEHRLRFFSRERTKRAHRLAWHLLSAIAVNGHGRIPPNLVSLPLSTSHNQTKKNQDVPIAAIAAVGWLGQDDSETLDALIERLQRAKGTAWLTSDIVAALTALTGRNFGHDTDRWLAFAKGRGSPKTK